jgi:hypothetical protein
MRLIRDEQAYFHILDDFVARRVSAAVFMPRFRHLWQCDGAHGIDNVPAKVDEVNNNRRLYGILGAIDKLCETYAYNLPDGRGYRVSEEQFRKEVESRTTTLPLQNAPRTCATPSRKPRE